MKRNLYIAALLVISFPAAAQFPEDALRTGWNIPSGTARTQAVGGAIGALGGDITSLYVNPAGLGFYKTSDFVLSPGFSFLKNKSSYRETDAAGNQLSRFNLNTSGFVFGYSNPNSRWKSSAFGIAINRTANFNSDVYYRGLNDYSSFSEVYAADFAASGLDIGGNWDYDNRISVGTKMAAYTYLIDTATINNEVQVVGRPEYLAETMQENSIRSKGGVTELALGFAGNMNDKFYIGASVGIPFLNYRRTTIYTESDPSGDDDNNFNFSRLEENYKLTGVGVNVKLGVIYKPAEQLRLGFALQSPTLYGLKDKSSAKMVTDVEKLFGNDPIDSITSDHFYPDGDPTFKYDLTTPWKFTLSGSYVIREEEDVTRQRGFITADVEYVTHGSSRFSAAEEDDDDEYYKSVNTATKQAYKGAFNFRVGGEVKFNVLMVRLGYAYYGNPYDDKELKSDKMNISGGLGYRNKGIFIDLTYVHSTNKDVNFPYRLSDKANTFARLKDVNSNILMTVGFKF
jgi:long-subunit fatty acid transport protein